MKILVGVDGSDHAQRAVEWCATYAGALDAEVVAVHAVDIPVIIAPMTAAFPVPQFAPEDRDKLRDLITNEWCAPLTKASVPFRVVLMDSGPALAILQTAKTEKADLIVTGRRGRGGFAELVLGSTSNALTHHAECPIVIVP